MRVVTTTRSMEDVVAMLATVITITNTYYSPTFCPTVCIQTKDPTMRLFSRPSPSMQLSVIATFALLGLAAADPSGEEKIKAKRAGFDIGVSRLLLVI